MLQTSDLGNRGDESSDFGILNITEASQVYSILQKEGYLTGLQENIEKAEFVDGDKYFIRAAYKAANLSKDFS